MSKKTLLNALLLVAVLVIAFFLRGTGEPEAGNVPLPAPAQTTQTTAPAAEALLTGKEEVARYLHEHGELPANFLTKKEAEDLGWNAQAGNLWEVAPGMSIGGDRFYNREGLLPEKDGRRYYECDINYSGGRRGAERIVYSNDGLIFYTGDHYETFEPLY